MNRRNKWLRDAFNLKSDEADFARHLAEGAAAHVKRLREAGQPRAGAERIRPTPFGTITEGGTRPRRPERSAKGYVEQVKPSLSQRFAARAHAANAAEQPARRPLAERLARSAGRGKGVLKDAPPGTARNRQDSGRERE